jgi:hypothetical protein
MAITNAALACARRQRLATLLPPELWRPPRANGNCYVTSEALYHLLGGKAAGWKPMSLPMNGGTHWFLKHESGLILDATAVQFRGQHVPYSRARGRGFLTKHPSRRARLLMRKLVFTD